MGITQFVDKVIQKCDEKDAYSFGSIWWLPVSEIKEVPMVLNIERSNPHNHKVVQGKIEDLNKDIHFNPAIERIPIKLLKIKLKEEVLIVKAKIRPCILLNTHYIDGLEQFIEEKYKKISAHLNKKLYLLSPMYSCSSPKDDKSFSPRVTARVKCLHYKHLFYCPRFTEDEAHYGSILRLDHIFSSHLSRGCNPSGFKFSDEYLEIFLQHLISCFGGMPSEEYIEIKELVENSNINPTDLEVQN